MAIFSPPKDVDQSRYPVYSGFIEVNGPTAADSYHVSYLGLLGSLKDKQVLDDTDAFFDVPLPVVLNPAQEAQLGPMNYTFVGDDAPMLLYRLAFGTAKLRVDLVDPNVEFTPTIGPRDLLSGFPIFTFPDTLTGGSFSQVKVLGPLTQNNYLTRNNDDTSEFGNAYNTFPITPTFANGTAIPNGMYRFLVRALRVTGDAENESNYESWLSPIVGFQLPSA
jgi:hypothetical protein